MAENEIVVEKGTEVLDPAGAIYKQLMAGAASERTAAAESKEVKVGLKDKPEAKVTAEVEADDNDVSVKGLKLELKRVRDMKGEALKDVQTLREDVANLKGQVEVLRSGSPGDQTVKAKAKLDKYSDEDLLTGETEWTETLAEAASAIDKAKANQDDGALTEATHRRDVARATVNLIKAVLHDRSKPKDKPVQEKQPDGQAGAQAGAEVDVEGLKGEVDSLYSQAYKTFPDLKDKKSGLWEAGNKAFNENKNLKSVLGPLAELVAVATAIVRNPELIGNRGSAGEARKELLQEITDTANQALRKGSGTTASSGKTINFEELDAQTMEALISRVKQGR